MCLRIHPVWLGMSLPSTMGQMASEVFYSHQNCSIPTTNYDQSLSTQILRKAILALPTSHLLSLCVAVEYKLNTRRLPWKSLQCGEVDVLSQFASCIILCLYGVSSSLRYFKADGLADLCSGRKLVYAFERCQISFLLRHHLPWAGTSPALFTPKFLVSLVRVSRLWVFHHAIRHVVSGPRLHLESFVKLLIVWEAVRYKDLKGFFSRTLVAFQISKCSVWATFSAARENDHDVRVQYLCEFLKALKKVARWSGGIWNPDMGDTNEGDKLKLVQSRETLADPTCKPVSTIP